MKKKQVQAKKLTLNKKAISSLNGQQMDQLAGGAFTAGISVCAPCITQNPVTVCGNCPTNPNFCPTSRCA